jgi:outer membrane protein
MKKVFLSIIILLSVFATDSFAQKGKFGHINSSDLLALMPERATAQTQLQNYSKELEDQLNLMNQEFQAKYNDYIAKQDSMSTAIRQMKEEELQSLQQRIQTFQQTAQQDLQTKEGELLQPIIDKAKDAIKEVAKEQGYAWVFDTSMGSLVVWPEDSDNLMELVKTKLAIL